VSISTFREKLESKQKYQCAKTSDYIYRWTEGGFEVQRIDWGLDRNGLDEDFSTDATSLIRDSALPVPHDISGSSESPARKTPELTPQSKAKKGQKERPRSDLSKDSQSAVDVRAENLFLS
jgi:hypothetical protein